jgi:hypothetical protein
MSPSLGDCPFFGGHRIGDLGIFEKHADDAIVQVKARLRQGYPVDFQVLNTTHVPGCIRSLPDLGYDISIYTDNGRFAKI